MAETTFTCKLCQTEVLEDWQWLRRGSSQILVHYHCMAQHYDNGFVQMQLFDLERYLDV